MTAKLLNSKRTDAGEQTVSIEDGSVRILSGRTDVTKNYAVSLGDGKLIINQKGDLKVTVDAESLSHVYDGAGHGIKAAEASDAKGTTIEYSTDGAVSYTHLDVYKRQLIRYQTKKTQPEL